MTALSYLIPKKIWKTIITMTGMCSADPRDTPYTHTTRLCQFYFPHGVHKDIHVALKMHLKARKEPQEIPMRDSFSKFAIFSPPV